MRRRHRRPEDADALRDHDPGVADGVGGAGVPDLGLGARAGVAGEQQLARPRPGAAWRIRRMSWISRPTGRQRSSSSGRQRATRPRPSPWCGPDSFTPLPSAGVVGRSAWDVRSSGIALALRRRQYGACGPGRGSRPGVTLARETRRRVTAPPTAAYGCAGDDGRRRSVCRRQWVRLFRPEAGVRQGRRGAEVVLPAVAGRRVVTLASSAATARAARAAADRALLFPAAVGDQDADRLADQFLRHRPLDDLGRRSDVAPDRRLQFG